MYDYPKDTYVTKITFCSNYLLLEVFNNCKIEQQKTPEANKIKLLGLG